jgi:aminoglycoside phosphotransferase (APT) family kinase protein
MTFDAVPVRQFAGGWGNLNYLVSIDGAQAVLRQPPLGMLPRGANDMAREHKVLSELHRVFPLAPRSIVFCSDEQILGAPFLIMEYRDGHVFHDNLLPIGQRSNFARAIGEMVVRIQVDLHSLQPNDIGLQDLGRADGFVERTVAGWHKRAILVAADDHSLGLDFIHRWLLRHQTSDTNPVLIHNDFKLNNIILDRTELTRPVAVLDWDMTTRGSALFDFATLLTYWVEPTDPGPIVKLGQMPSAAWPGFLSRREAINLYSKLSGRDLSDLPFFYILALYKFAIVILQLQVKAAVNQASSATGPDWIAIASASINQTVELIEDGFRGW